MVGILKDFQPLVASFFAVIAALIGFGGVIYAHRQMWRNSEIERTHRQQMRDADAEAEEQRTLASLTSALSAELSAMWNQLNGIRPLVDAQRVVYEEMSKQGVDRAPYPGKMVPEFQTPIFDAHVAKIGILPASLSFSVAKVYSSLKSIGGRRAELGEQDIRLAATLLKAMSLSLDVLANDIHDTVMRLHAVRMGHSDPGIGSGDQFYKAQESNKEGEMLSERTRFDQSMW